MKRCSNLDTPLNVYRGSCYSSVLQACAFQYSVDLGQPSNINLTEIANHYSRCKEEATPRKHLKNVNYMLK